MSAQPPAPAPARDGRSTYLPDFCEARTVLAFVLVAALVAVVLALARQNVGAEFLTELAQVSVYLLSTIAFASAPSFGRRRASGVGRAPRNHVPR